MAEEYNSEIYSSSIGPRTAVGPSRPAASNMGNNGTGGRRIRIETEIGSKSATVPPTLSGDASKSFLEAAEKEKKTMKDLNDRLGNYIGRVKELEEKNRQLVAELGDLRANWGKDTSDVKVKYTVTLSESRGTIDNAARQKAEVDVKVARLRDDLNEYRSRYEDIQARRSNDQNNILNYTNAINDAKAELEMLQARWKQLTDEEKRLNSDNLRLWEELTKARNDLDEETLGRIDYQNQVQTLMEELAFLGRIHEQEVKELQALLERAPASTKDFFKNELALAIRDIRNEYEFVAEQGRNDMESFYKLKVSEVQGNANRSAIESKHQREETQRFRDAINESHGRLNDLEARNSQLENELKNLNYQLSDDQRQYEQALNERDATLHRMRDELRALMAELQALLETKQMLDAEIAIYRKMLESEENRLGLRQMVEQVLKTHSLQQQENTDSNRNVRGETQTKTTSQRSSKGNITISECEGTGKYIILENTHGSKSEDISGCKIKQKVESRGDIVYTIPSGVTLKPKHSIKIYAREQGGHHNPPESLVNEAEKSWGTGPNVVTTFINRDGEERATHTQKTIQIGQ
jgi:intermediate filament protein if